MKTINYILTISLFFSFIITDAQLKVISDNSPYMKGHVYFRAYEGDGTSGTAYIQARDMSGSSSIAFQFRTQNSGSIVNALRISPNGKVGIGIASDNPYGILTVKGGINRFEYNNWPLDFVLQAVDPRICSANKVVFYKNWIADYLDIECKIAYEFSDSTAKTNFTKIENSLEKLKKIDGYSYNWKSDKNGPRHSGLLAQQVERVISEAVSTIDSTGQKLIAYSHITPYLIEAIKEQQEQIDELTTLINSLKSTGNVDNSTIETCFENSLEQNSPNPFTIDTKINLTISDKVSEAFVYIFNLQGSLIKSYMISERGKTSITISAAELNPGMYVYTLITDGKEIDSKRMILTQ